MLQFKCPIEKHMTSVTTLSAKMGYPNAFGKSMRFNSCVCSNLLRIFSRSNHKPTKRLLMEICSYGITRGSYGSTFLDKVSVMIGHSRVQDFIEHEITQRGSGGHLRDRANEVDLALACRRFPCIKLGSSSLMELYESPCQKTGILVAEDCEGYLSGPVGSYCAEPAHRSESSLPLLDTSSDGTSSLLDRDNSNTMSVLPSQASAKVEENFDTVDPESVVQTGKQLKHGCESQELVTSREFILDRPINCISGVTTRHCRQLEKSGFHTVRKLLHHFPRSYADLQNAHGGVDDGQYLIFVGKVLSSRGIKAGSSFAFLEVTVACELASNDETMETVSKTFGGEEKRTIYLHLKKFFRGTRFTYPAFLRSLESKHKEEDLVYVSGKVKAMHKKDHFELREYTVDMLKEEDEYSNIHGEARPYPLYPSKGGLKPSFLRGIIFRTLQALDTDIDPIPSNIIEEFNLLGLRDAYMQIHHPMDLNQAELARRRLIFDEFFYLQLGQLFQMLGGLGTQIERDCLLDKYKNHETSVVDMKEWSPLTRNLLKALRFSLTPSQLNAVSEIIWDLKRPIPMNRLLQGDVGCGKTMVAFLACMEVIGSGFQAAFMVPSELLAMQHYEDFLSLLDNVEGLPKASVALLTGSTPSKQSRLIRNGLQVGDISLVIGTHSLISDSVEFAALRIAVVDEQHRFGVIQRGRFNSKLYSIAGNLRTGTSSEEASTDKATMAPHVLAMSATPIPRTLALALHGDMSLTQITDLPPGRKPVETCSIEGNDRGFEKVYQMMQDELQTGGKVYLVYPVIEESEQLPQLHAAAAHFESIPSKFGNYQCGLLHGRMKCDEKDEALRRFRSGETQILLSTQVIEIGVDVPDASMMVVMNAERFGIAQLHQLRGRVGRGTRKSKCIFLASSAGALNRLKLLEKSSDGFYLANMDLMLRGPGDLLGKKQSGHLPEFPITRLDVDGNILQDAHFAALKVLSASHDLETFPKLKVELSMRQPLFVG